MMATDMSAVSPPTTKPKLMIPIDGVVGRSALAATRPSSNATNHATSRSQAHSVGSTGDRRSFTSIGGRVGTPMPSAASVIDSPSHLDRGGAVPDVDDVVGRGQRMQHLEA